MSFRDPRALAWEGRLKAVFDRIDRELEERHGSDWPRHPVRPPRGETANPEDDGLFDLGAAFSAGYGRGGPGYVLQIRISTLDQVPSAKRAVILEIVTSRLSELLPEAFPGRELRVEREEDGVLRIVGDLTLV